MECTGKTSQILNKLNEYVADYKIAIWQPVSPEFFATKKRSIAGSLKLTGLRLF